MPAIAWVAVGRLLRTRGRAGEFIAELDSPDPTRADRLGRVLLRKPPREGNFQVAEAWYHDGRPVLRFEGVDSISSAEPWEHAEILVPETELDAPAPGAYSHADLVGCRVEQRGESLGVIIAIDEFGGPPVLRLATTSGGELLIPFVKTMCPEIDIAGKRVRVELPEGLTEL